MTLYDIDQRLLMLETYGVDTETGEVAVSDEDFMRMYEEVAMDMQTKLSDTACFIKNLLSDAEQIKQEEAKLSARRKAKERLAERLQNSMNGVIINTLNDGDMESVNKWKLETPKCRISYRKSQKVEITDINKIPKEFIKEEITYKPDKDKIGKILKRGETVEGTELVTNMNMQIK